jgi:hypothetical protein
MVVTSVVAENSLVVGMRLEQTDGGILSKEEDESGLLHEEWVLEIDFCPRESLLRQVEEKWPTEICDSPRPLFLQLPDPREKLRAYGRNDMTNNV